MRKKTFFLIFLILIFVLIPVFSVFAAPSWWPIVPCGRTGQDPCTRCDLFKLTKNIIDFILQGLVPPVAAVLFIAAGLMIVLAGANPKFYATGIAIFKNTFWGLVIILASWMITNTFLKSLAPAQADAPWYSLKCEVEEKKITAPDPIAPPSNVLCSNPPALAAYYSSVYPRKNSPELNALISCVNSALSGFIDQSQRYTFETRNNSCNYTRGRDVCGACEHKIDSCHYGGAGGASGAKAVDFNSRGISEQKLFQKLQSISRICNFGSILFEGGHTHVSTQGCAGN